ncbi:tetratricopeptide repeat protein [Hymenobacter sp. BT664]|uniref:Tetratricopeptide repeat protein n=1 Tax=Hymenobacter montanus TaxID=2771359 RepID=A0A927BDB9_9BACT|nr:tetratricopeptide repeat protein [Hymenobacter montanus]MBD2768018.1 tetratricopeptide repeat protein [Hymenobacter montanus]
MKEAEAGRTVVARPALLTASGETVPFEVMTRVPARHLRKGVAYELLLRYRYEHGLREDTLGRITFTVGNYVYDEENKGQLLATQKFTLPNTPNRNPGELLAHAQVRELKANGRVLRAADDVRVARGIGDPTRLVTREDTVLSLLPEHASNSMSGTRVLPFFFDEGQWFVRGYLGTNVAALEDLIDANQQTTQVLIIAGHSPDSVDAHNRALASKRVRMLLYYYKERVKMFSYLNKVQNIKFDTLAYTRRWDTFLSKVMTSALKSEQMDSVVSIINDAQGTFEDKEKALHQLSYFDYIQQYIYPVLRFGTVAVTYTAPKRYDSEVYLLSKKILDKQAETEALTPEELRYSATLTPLLAEKQRIYEMAAANTNSWEAFHNLGVILLQRAEKELTEKMRNTYRRRAAVNFTMAAHRNPTAESFYYAAIAYHRAGDRPEALQNYDYAIKLGGQRTLLRKIFSDRAALEIELGQPDQALRSLQYAGPSYQNALNRGLVLLGREGYDLALQQYLLAHHLRPQAAAPLYGMAVVAARRKNEPAMGKLLKQAVALDRSYAQRAVEDLEFLDYSQSKVFQEALR